jgi:glutamine synthetase
VHHGLTQKIDPGAAVVGDGYAQAAESGERIPTNWFAATDRFADSAALKDYLGERFVRMFATVKRVEQERYQSAIPNVDFDWYLRAC